MEEQESLSAKIAHYIAERAAPKFEALAKKAEKERQKVVDKPETLSEMEAGWAEEEIALKAQFDPTEWLTDAARRAAWITFATHPIKFTHSQIKGASSCYAVSAEEMPEKTFISTASLSRPVIDVDGNAAALDVAALLQLEHEGKSLLEHIQKQDADPLRPFAKSEAQLVDWMQGFAQAVSAATTSSHSLAKQLYFPIGEGKYHLLSPLFSSSLTQAIYERIQAARFSEEMKAARKAKREGKFHPEVLVEYPGLAVMSFGGTKPQNISQLNSRRGGKTFLLPCTPPQWKRRSTPPFRTTTVFSRHHFGEYSQRETWLLTTFLEKVVSKNSTLEIRSRRAAFVDRILDLLIQYAAEIHTAFAGGWSKDATCQLHHAEQLWLDPRRGKEDEAFALERAKNEWQETIADRFARWLNKRIEESKGKQILFTGDAEYGEWKSLLQEKIRLLRDEWEVFP